MLAWNRHVEVSIHGDGCAKQRYAFYFFGEKALPPEMFNFSARGYRYSTPVLVRIDADRRVLQDKDIIVFVIGLYLYLGCIRVRDCELANPGKTRNNNAN
jgi:hypothetical protein